MKISASSRSRLLPCLSFSVPGPVFNSAAGDNAKESVVFAEALRINAMALGACFRSALALAELVDGCDIGPLKRYQINRIYLFLDSKSFDLLRKL
ncbi:MAG: hypothetical protein Q7R22_005730 [Verrucomicrobiota bacterium JB025]|nr:hypothetical protein [Verrucomicrobiota bacterium JB025]